MSKKDLNEILGKDLYRYEMLSNNVKSTTHCCLPASIKFINYNEMTITAQILIKEKK